MKPNVLSGHELVCYRGDHCLFTDMKFEVHSGQLLLIEGANGSGKTSLLKLIAGLRMPDEGSIQWDGHAIATMGSDYRQCLAYVGHQDGVKRELTVFENLKLLQRLLSQGQQAVDKILQDLKLEIYRDSLVGVLSAGQRRRIALARALYSQARLWVLDEPFTALDKFTTEFVEQAFQDHMNSGGIVVVTSHQKLNLANADIQHLKIAA